MPNERNPVQRLKLPGLFVALLLGLAPGGATLAQQAPTPPPLVVPPGPVSHFATRFDVVDAPEQFDRVLLIIDFPGGAWTPSHAPGGYLYATVIEGEISTRTAGAPGHDETYPAGSTFTANAGEYLELGNTSAATARVIATALLPKGAPLTIDQAGFSSDAYSGPTDDYRVLDSVARAPRPTTVYHSSIAVERPAGAFELVHVVLDFDPGVWTPRHMHGGQELVMLTTGELTLQRQGEVKVFTAGESWVNTSGLVHAAGNDAGSFAQAVATFLLPAGRPLTTVV
jgi:quercetin dioxygenase-like cupin family protein